MIHLLFRAQLKNRLILSSYDADKLSTAPIAFSEVGTQWLRKSLEKQAERINNGSASPTTPIDPTDPPFPNEDPEPFPEPGEKEKDKERANN